MLKHYKTIQSKSVGEFKDRGSKFIGYAYPIISEVDFKTKLKELQIEHPKNRHICTAFRVGIETIIERANDDGEPSGSAGQPILRQIHSFSLENVGISVVRYFGGTLLGVSGLIIAYKTAAHLALENAKIVDKEVEAIYNLECGYDVFHNLMNYIKQEDFSVYKQNLTEKCKLKVGVPVTLGKVFEENLLNFTGIKYRFEDYS